MSTARRPALLLPLLFLMLLPACSGDAPLAKPPALDLQPVELGGDHRVLLEACLGPTQAYRLRHRGPNTRFAVVVEVLERGTVVETQQLCAGTYPPDVDSVLGLIALAPRQEGGVTELTCALSQSGLVLHRSAQLAAWDRLAGKNEGVATRAWRQPQSFELQPGKPVVLWRWWRGEDVPLDVPLTAPPPAEVASVMQVSIRFGK